MILIHIPRGEPRGMRILPSLPSLPPPTRRGLRPPQADRLSEGPDDPSALRRGVARGRGPGWRGNPQSFQRCRMTCDICWGLCIIHNILYIIFWARVTPSPNRDVGCDVVYVFCIVHYKFCIPHYKCNIIYIPLRIVIVPGGRAAGRGRKYISLRIPYYIYPCVLFYVYYYVVYCLFLFSLHLNPPPINILI